MKIILISILICFISFTLSGTDKGRDRSKPPFSYKTYGNEANYFEDEKELPDFFGFKNKILLQKLGLVTVKMLLGSRC